MPVTTNPVKVHNSDCVNVCCSGFERIQSFSPDVTFLDPQFAAYVEPISLFDNTATSIDRQAMMPTLQLASLLVQATLPFFHTLLFGPGIITIPQDVTARKQMRFIKESTWQTMTQEDIDNTWSRLQSFASTKKIIIGLDDHPVRSCTVALHDPAPVTGDIREVGIRLNKVLYDEINDAYKSENVDVAESVQLHARMACLLGHELAHCVAMLRHGNNHEIYFGDCPVAEEGFEWQKRAFGGMLGHDETQYNWTGQSHYPGSRTSKMLVLDEFPNKCLLQTYQEANGRMGNQRLLPNTYLSWNTDLKHLLRLFTREFWEVDYFALGIEAVHYKVTGARMITRPDGQTWPLLNTSSIPDTVPNGYLVSRKGLLYPATGCTAVQLSDSDFGQEDLDYCRLLDGVDQEGIPCFC